MDTTKHKDANGQDNMEFTDKVRDAAVTMFMGQNLELEASIGNKSASTSLWTWVLKDQFFCNSSYNVVSHVPAIPSIPGERELDLAVQILGKLTAPHRMAYLMIGMGCAQHDGQRAMVEMEKLAIKRAQQYLDITGERSVWVMTFVGVGMRIWAYSKGKTRPMFPDDSPAGTIGAYHTYKKNRAELLRCFTQVRCCEAYHYILAYDAEGEQSHAEKLNVIFELHGSRGEISKSNDRVHLANVAKPPPSEPQDDNGRRNV